MSKIDLARARELLQAAVDTQGRDFVYNDYTNAEDWDKPCLNIPYDDSFEGRFGPVLAESNRRKTGCLVGTALKLAGVPVDERPASGAGGFSEFVTQMAIQYLTTAQGAQDRGASWGEAYDKAEAWAKEKSK